MARPLRIEFDGALYHVTSRGNVREPIFITDTNRVLFLDKKISFNSKIKDPFGLYGLPRPLERLVGTFFLLPSVLYSAIGSCTAV